MKKVGFIGTGNMATAIAKGIVSGDMKNQIAILAFDVNAQKAKEFCEMSNGAACASASELSQKSDYVFLAVKPQNIENVMNEIKGGVNENAVFISIIAGLSSEYVKKSFGFDAKVIPVMPNTPLLLGCGAIAMAKVKPVSDDEYGFVKNIFASSGTVCDVSEDKMKEIIAVNGSSPAFIYLFAKYFIDYAKRESIDERTALELFCKTLEGSAKMITDSGYSIDELIKMVSSPGGTTLAGLDAFYDGNLDKIVADACERCVNRAYELSK